MCVDIMGVTGLAVPPCSCQAVADLPLCEVRNCLLQSPRYSRPWLLKPISGGPFPAS